MGAQSIYWFNTYLAHQRFDGRTVNIFGFNTDLAHQSFDACIGFNTDLAHQSFDGRSFDDRTVNIIGFNTELISYVTSILSRKYLIVFHADNKDSDLLLPRRLFGWLCYAQCIR